LNMGGNMNRREFIETIARPIILFLIGSKIIPKEASYNPDVQEIRFEHGLDFIEDGSTGFRNNKELLQKREMELDAILKTPEGFKIFAESIASPIKYSYDWKKLAESMTEVLKVT